MVLQFARPELRGGADREPADVDAEGDGGGRATHHEVRAMHRRRTVCV